MKSHFLFSMISVLFISQFITGCGDDDGNIDTDPTPNPPVTNVPHSVWDSSKDNPVLTSRTGFWDGEYVSATAVVIFNDTLRMWYEGSTGIFDQPIHLGYAWSLDGNNWTLQDQPVIEAMPGEWDYPHLAAPSVYVDGDTLRMWYGGGTYTTVGMAIGYATSVDGVHWDKKGKVINSGQYWNPGGVLPGPVLNEEGVYKMWFSGGQGHVGLPTEDTFWSIGYATSSDGIEWTVAEDPVISHGTTGQIDYNQALAGTVINADTSYVMYYSASRKVTNYSISKIAMAFSVDGITWEKYGNNPIIDKSLASDALYFPKVLEYHNEFRMWYAAWHPGPFVHTATATN